MYYMYNGVNSCSIKNLQSMFNKSKTDLQIKSNLNISHTKTAQDLKR